MLVFRLFLFLLLHLFYYHAKKAARMPANGKAYVASDTGTKKFMERHIFSTDELGNVLWYLSGWLYSA